MLWAAVAAAPAWTRGGACVPVERDRILARDLAAVHAEFSSLSGDTPLGYAPAPGVRRSLGVAELKRLGSRYGLTLAPAAEVCFERPLAVLTPDGLRAAIEASLRIPGARVEILEFSRYPAPRGEIEFPRAGLAAPPASAPQAAVVWRGHVRYAGSRRFGIWARVRIRVAAARVVAVSTLRAGQVVEAAQVRLETGEGFPLREPPAQSLEEVVGRVARQTIPAGSPVWPRLVESVREVKRGDMVRVEVSSGGARLALDARAERAGRRGDTIAVRNLASGKRFPARVEGAGKVAASVPAGIP